MGAVDSARKAGKESRYGARRQEQMRGRVAGAEKMKGADQEQKAKKLKEEQGNTIKKRQKEPRK